MGILGGVVLTTHILRLWVWRGRVQVRGSQASDAVEGDVAHIPAGTEHWHGAHHEEEHAMQHLAITFGEPTWLEPVSEEQYSAG